MAEKVAQKLGGEDTAVDHDLGERTPDAPLGGRSDFRDVQGYCDQRSSGSNTGDEAAYRQNTNVGSERFSDGTKSCKGSGESHWHESAISRRHGAGSQGTAQAAESKEGADEANLGNVHWNTLWQSRHGGAEGLPAARDNILRGVKFSLPISQLSVDM